MPRRCGSVLLAFAGRDRTGANLQPPRSIAIMRCWASRGWVKRRQRQRPDCFDGRGRFRATSRAEMPANLTLGAVWRRARRCHDRRASELQPPVPEREKVRRWPLIALKRQVAASGTPRQR